MEVSELWDLEYCNDKDLNSLNPSKVVVKEAQFKVNLEADIKSKEQSDQKELAPVMTEKQKRIAELKKQLLAPTVKKKP